MHVNNHSSHLAGRKHQQKVATQNNIQAAQIRPPGAGSSRRRAYTARERISDDQLSEDDGRSILREIDTAFGLLPHGGAYKESNFYYDT